MKSHQKFPLNVVANFNFHAEYPAGNGRVLSVLSTAANGKVHYIAFLYAGELNSPRLALKSFPDRQDAIEYAKKRANLMLRAAVRHKRWLKKNAAAIQQRQEAARVQKAMANEAWGQF